MSRILTVTVSIVLASLASAAEVKIGTKIDDLQFKDIRFVSRSLKDLGDKKAYVLVFVESSCPLVAKYMPALNRLEKDYRSWAQVAGVLDWAVLQPRLLEAWQMGDTSG